MSGEGPPDRANGVESRGRSESRERTERRKTKVREGNSRMNGENAPREIEGQRAIEGPMLFRGRGLKGLSKPRTEGEVILNTQQVSFFGDFDVDSGVCINPELDLTERSVAGKILVFPSGAGSTVGSYSLINMALGGAAPKAIIVNRSDPVILLGCCVAEIPHVHMFDVDITEELTDGAIVTVDSEDGTVELMEKS